MLCPACSESLVECPCKSGPAFACGGCGGVWLGNVVAEQMAEGRDDQVRRVAEAADAAAAEAPPAIEVATYRASIARRRSSTTGAPCPVCGGALVAVPISRSGVIVDLCPQHGSWFEAGELKQVDAVYADLRQRPKDETRRSWLLDLLGGASEERDLDGLFDILSGGSSESGGGGHCSDGPGGSDDSSCSDSGGSDGGSSHH